MNIGLASDHAGYEMKETLKKWLINEGHSIIDFGCNSTESCDYPDFAHPLAQSISDGPCNFGVSICGSGNGINMVVNKYPHIRSALCWNKEISELARKHNAANICAIPARFIDTYEAIEILKTFLETEFEGGRHLNRVLKIGKIPNFGEYECKVCGESFKDHEELYEHYDENHNKA